MRAGLVAFLASLLLLGGCDPTGGAGGPRLYLFVPSSMADLTDAVTAEFLRVRKTEPIPVYQSSAGSQTLRIQIEGGAPADVFISADPEHIAALEEAGLVRDVRTFAYNGLAVVVPADNPAGIESFWDLPRAERLVIGTPEVPIGRYTRLMLAQAAAARPPGPGEARFDERVMARVVSEETNVRLVRSKVELGEADAAVVYRTDALGRHDLLMIPPPPEADVLAEYRVGLVVGRSQGREPDLVRVTAESWIDLLLSDAGRRIVSAHGFVVPR